MKVLLDTHVVLWWYTRPNTLSAQAMRIIESTENTVFASAVSTWELCVKKAIGKITFPDTLLDKIQSDFIELPITAIHARQILTLERIHSDPFDRLLVAQAKVDELVLLTRDKNILKYDIELVQA